MALARPSTPALSPATESPRAKVLRARTRPEVRPDTREALLAFEDAASAFEDERSAYLPGVDVRLDTRALRRAASSVMSALCRELEAGTGSMPKALADDVLRWIDGEYAGTDVDVEIANHAVNVLLGSDVCAELPR